MVSNGGECVGGCGWLGTHARLLASVVTAAGRSLIRGGGEATGVVGFEEKLVDV